MVVTLGPVGCGAVDIVSFRATVEVVTVASGVVVVTVVPVSDDAFGIVTFVGAAICVVVFVADELEGKYVLA